MLTPKVHHVRVDGKRESLWNSGKEAADLNTKFKIGRIDWIYNRQYFMEGVSKKWNILPMRNAAIEDIPVT